MTQKQPWNIWRIKSRWLRAAFAAFVGIPILFAVIVFCAALSVAAGTVEGAKYAWWIFTKHQDRTVYQSFWRAVTLKTRA